MTSLNGAHALLATLRANASRLLRQSRHFGNAFRRRTRRRPRVRAILCLFEGVATGRPTATTRHPSAGATLLHLGPDSPTLANLHNARRANVPVLNIVGDHATYHATYDAPSRATSRPGFDARGWHRRTTNPDDVASDTSEAIGAAYGPPGQIATLILPATCPGMNSRQRLRSGRRVASDSGRTDQRELGERLKPSVPDERHSWLVARPRHVTVAPRPENRPPRPRSSCRNLSTIMERGSGVATPERLITSLSRRRPTQGHRRPRAHRCS